MKKNDIVPTTQEPHVFPDVKFTGEIEIIEATPIDPKLVAQLQPLKQIMGEPIINPTSPRPKLRTIELEDFNTFIHDLEIDGWHWPLPILKKIQKIIDPTRPVGDTFEAMTNEDNLCKNCGYEKEHHKDDVCPEYVKTDGPDDTNLTENTIRLINNNPYFDEDNEI